MDRDIEPINDRMLPDLCIEDLESRLEMQIAHVPESSCMMNVCMSEYPCIINICMTEEPCDVFIGCSQF